MTPYWRTSPYAVAVESHHIQASDSNPITVDALFLAYHPPSLRLEYMDRPMIPLWGGFIPVHGSLAGYWCGRYAYDDGRESDSFGGFVVDEFVGESGKITGFGADAMGDYYLVGRLNGMKFVFMKQYSALDGPVAFIRMFRGRVSPTFDEITGTWSTWSLQAPNPSFWTEWQNELHVIVKHESADHGTFHFTRRPGLHISSRPTVEQFNLDKIRSLWKYAINAVLCLVRRPMLKSRRLRRTAYNLLLLERQKNWGRLPPGKEILWKDIVSLTVLDDLRFWRMEGDTYARRREIFHQ